MIVAIDGPAGTGKSTVAKAVAKALRLPHFDTGAMYRALAWVYRSSGKSLEELLPTFRFAIERDSSGNARYFANGSDVTETIRTQEVAKLASEISARPEVRAALVQIQRAFGEGKSAVFEGRDMGTVVFPQAQVKIFLTARPEVRAQRRYRELIAKCPDQADQIDPATILKQMEARDFADIHRAHSPLRQAADALVIDTSDLSIQEVVDQIVSFAKQKNSPMGWGYALVYWTVRLFFRLFFRLEILGLEHFPPGAAIIAPNHASLYDPPVVSISCPEEVHFLAKESLFQIPLLGRLIRGLNAHPVTRSAADAATFRLILHLLAKGKKVILFPEGIRTPDGNLLPIQRGISFLAFKARCRIVPVYVNGTFAAWPRTKKWPRLTGKIRVAFGPPIEWNAFAAMNREEAEEAIGKALGQSLRDLEKTMRPR